MNDRGKDIPNDFAYVPEVTYKKLTSSPEKWSKPSFQPLPDGSGEDRFEIAFITPLTLLT